MPETLPLQPVDSVTITTLVDNYLDLLLTDHGPAKRLGLPTTETPRVTATTFEEGQTPDGPLAEHGFSAMITMMSGDRGHRVLSTRVCRRTDSSRTCGASATRQTTSRRSS